MTPVPANVFDEAEAYACRWITRAFATTDSPWSNDPWASPAASRAFVRHTLEWMLETASGRLHVIALARAGDPDAFELLNSLMMEMKSRLGGLPTTELKAWDMEVGEAARRTGKYPPFGQFPGPKKKNNLLRDLIIALTVSAVADRYGLPPTGNSPRKHSASKVVASALVVVRRGMGHKAVEHIWETYSGAMPTVRGWTANSTV